MNKQIAQDRRNDELQECTKPLRHLLADKSVTDVMLNPDGKLWCDKTGVGRKHVADMSASDANTILRLVAFKHQTPITRHSPIIDNGTLPGTNERISGTRDPVTEGPSFAIRVPPSEVQTHFPDGASKSHAPQGESDFDSSNLDLLRQAVDDYKNIAIVGSTGSGKTSLMSLLLRQMSNRRLLIFEDTKELVVEAPDHVRFLSIKDVVSTARLLELALRYRPDGIIVGELRKREEAQIMIQSGNTGHRGSITGFHANSAEEGSNRLEDLCSTSTTSRAIRSALDVVAFVEKINGQRCISKVIHTNTMG